MTKPPNWWESLVTDPITERLGIDWHDPSDWKPADESWNGTMANKFIDDLESRHRKGKLKVGIGPSITRRGTAIDVPVNWFIDPDAPELLWCALGDFYAAWLWVPIPPTPDAIEEVLADSHPKPARERLGLTGFSRGIIGGRQQVMLPQVYTAEAVPFNGHDLDRYFAGVQYVEQSVWGSAHKDDPLRDDFAPVSPVVLTRAARDNNAHAQRYGRIPSMTWRSLHSRSYVSFEVHMRTLVCAAVRYQPSPAGHRQVVARLNAEFETDYPVDLPLDVIGALTGFVFVSGSELREQLEAPQTPAQLAAAIRYFAALWSGDLRSTLRLREFAGHDDPEVRLAVAQVAHWYGHRFLAEELALTETDEDQIAGLESLLLNGSSPDNYNAFADGFSGMPIMIDATGEPVETWSDDEDEEVDQ